MNECIRYLYLDFLLNKMILEYRNNKPATVNKYSIGFIDNILEEDRFLIKYGIFR